MPAGPPVRHTLGGTGRGWLGTPRDLKSAQGRQGGVDGGGGTRYTWRMAIKLTDEGLLKLADKSNATPVSVMRRLLGLPVRGRTGKRIDATLAVTGFRTVPPVKS